MFCKSFGSDSVAPKPAYRPLNVSQGNTQKSPLVSDVLGYDTWSENINAFLLYPHRM